MKKTIILFAFSLFVVMLYAQDNVVAKEGQFTQTQVKSLRARFMRAGRKYLNEFNGHKYWPYFAKSEESANLISEKLKISVDTLYILAKAGCVDYDIESQAPEEISLSRQKALHEFFSSPSTPSSEITAKYGIVGKLELFFAYDPNVKVGKESISEKFNISNNLKTYDGDFELKGFGYGVNNLELNGFAKYQYIEALDGSRIFEGEFKFKTKDGNATAEGFFKNNKQVGKWVWKTMPQDKYYGDRIYSELNFNVEGKLDGKFHIYIGNNAAPQRSFYYGKFDNGILMELEIKDRASFKMKGKYGKNKKPIGVWNIKLSEEGHTITMTYDEKGNLQKYGYRDESTGDWHEVMPTSNGRPEWMYTDFLRHIQYKYLLRSTKL